MNRLKSPKEKTEAASDLAPRWRPIRNFLRRRQGSMSVEFGLLAPIFVLLAFAVVDLGHAWYMKMEITSASREGARYGTRFYGPGSIPSSLNPTIANWVKNNYNSLLPTDANLTVTPGGAGYTSGTAGQDLTVQVSATKTWFVIGNLVPGLGDNLTMSATTDMKVE